MVHLTRKILNNQKINRSGNEIKKTKERYKRKNIIHNIDFCDANHLERVHKKGGRLYQRKWGKINKN